MKYHTNRISKVFLTLFMTTGTVGILEAAAWGPMRPEPDVSFLTEGAQAVFTQIKTLRTDIHGKVLAICGQTDADRTRMKACFANNEAAVWRDLGKTLRDACLPARGKRGQGAEGGRGFGPEGRGPGWGGGGPQGPRPELTAVQKQEFETKLLSSNCSQAIASVQEKLK